MTDNLSDQDGASTILMSRKRSGKVVGHACTCHESSPQPQASNSSLKAERDALQVRVNQLEGEVQVLRDQIGGLVNTASGFVNTT